MNKDKPEEPVVPDRQFIPDPAALPTREDLIAQYDEDRPKKGKRLLMVVLRLFGWIFVTALITGIIAAAGWYFWLSKDKDNQPATDESSENTSSDQQPADATTEQDTAEATNNFNSVAFGLQFDYPQSWQATEGVDNKVVATSPATQLQMAGGGTQNSQIMLTVQHKQASLPEFTKGSALAAIESEKIDYAKPSQVQRASTYISFLSYATSSVKGIDGVYITGDSGYVQNQYIPQDDVVKSDPLIMVTFRACDDEKCTTPGAAVTLNASAWGDTELAGQVKRILKSIVVQ